MYEDGSAHRHSTRTQIKETLRTNGAPKSAARIVRPHDTPEERAAYHLLVLEQEHVAPDFLAGSATNTKRAAFSE